MAAKTAKAELSLDRTLAKVMGHEVRVQALTILTERVASPKEISVEVGEKLGTVSHHVKLLREWGLIEIVDERPVRGAVEHFYKAIARPMIHNAESEDLSLEERETISAVIAQRILGDISRAALAGTLDARTDRYMTRTPLILDAEGWEEMQRAYDAALQATLDAQAASDERRARAGGEAEARHVSASLLCFEMPARETAAKD